MLLLATVLYLPPILAPLPLQVAQHAARVILDIELADTKLDVDLLPAPGYTGVLQSGHTESQCECANKVSQAVRPVTLSRHRDAVLQSPSSAFKRRGRSSRAQRVAPSTSSRAACGRVGCRERGHF